VDRSGIETLLGLTESGKVFHVGGHVVGLNTLDVVVSNLSCEVWVFAECFFDLGEESVSRVLLEEER
jgi:hypothetical protein